MTTPKLRNSINLSPLRLGLPRTQQLPRTQAMWIIRGFLLIPLALVCFALSTHTRAQPDTSAAKFPAANAYANSKLTYKIIDTPQHTYCYDVFADGRLMIHQASAPALPGNEGFKTKEDATKVALLVIDKIRRGEMPPTISIDEMKTRNVLK